MSTSDYRSTAYGSGYLKLDQNTNLKRVIMLPKNNAKECRITLSKEEDTPLEIIYPKNTPWLDWKTNDENNDPVSGKVLIIKGKFGYACAFRRGPHKEWAVVNSSFVFENNEVKEWAEIPED